MYFKKQKYEEINFLASAKFQAFTEQVASTHAQTVTTDGIKVVPAGAVWPANDATAKGILLNAVDVTHGPQPASVIVEGYIIAERLPAQPIAAAKTAMTGIKYR